MIRALVLGFGLLLASTVSANSVKIDPARTVTIMGEIRANALLYALQIESLAAKESRDPIHLVITSPGGSIAAGAQILSAMILAQSRGIEVRCYVPVYAASMGFQIFALCSKRYALKYAMLLFHPMAQSSDQRQTVSDLLYAAKRLRAWEKPFILDLLRVLKIKVSTFLYHYRNETLWMAFEFNKLSPDFLTVVDDIQGYQGLFRLP